MAKKRIRKDLCDSEGNPFSIERFTYNRKGKINGVLLKGMRGKKEISISDLKYYMACKKVK